MRFLFAVFIFLVATTTFSQSSVPGSEPVDVTPISPNAASLGKFGEIPVSLYTGVPSISVPLYTIDVNGYKLPISLNYHAGGVKVDDLGSSVGLGWALAAGGILNREQHGVPDETMVDEYVTHSSEVITMNDPQQESAHGTIANSWKTANYDTEPDIFSFNVGGESAKFFYEPNGEVHLVPAEKRFKIVHKGKYYFGDGSRYAWQKWEITDNNGITYVFSDVEENCIDASENPCNSNKNVNTWYLSSIVLPGKSVINFFYQKESFSEYRYVYQQRFMLVPNSPGCQPDATPNAQLIHHNMLRLYSIQFPGGGIDFLASTARSDIPEAKYIGKMEVYSTYPSKTPVKAYQFNYTNSSRLVLQSVAEINVKTGLAQQGYAFQYDDRLMSVPRFSTGQDLWGYYNGQNNFDLIPSLVSRNSSGMIVETMPGANRCVDEAFTQAGILKKITYPTGGYSNFEYENNEGVIGDASESSIRAAANWFQPFPIETKPIGFSSENLSQGNITSYSEPFEIKNDIRGHRDFEVTFTAHYMAYDGGSCPPQYYPSPGYPGSSYFNCATVSLEPVGPGQTRSITAIQFDRPYTFTQEGPWNSVFEQPGTYRFKIQWNQSLNGMFYVTANIKYDKISPRLRTDKGEMFLGGLRIKKITSQASGTSEVHIKKFDYEFDASDANHLVGVASGVPMNIPINVQSISYCKVCPPAIGGLATLVSATPVSGMLSTDKVNVGYRKVTVYSDDIGDNGKTESYFTTPVEYPDDALAQSIVWPYPRAKSYEWRRGLPVISNVFNKQGDILKKTVNMYAFNPGVDFSATKIVPVALYGPGNSGSGGMCFQVGGHTHYKIGADEMFYQSSVTEQVFVPGSATSFLQTDQLFAQDEKSLAMSEILSKTSKKGEISNYITHPLDYDVNSLPNPLSPVAKGLIQLINKNFLTKPVESIVVKRDASNVEVVISGTLFIYHADKPCIKKVYKFEPKIPVPLTTFQQSGFDANGQFVMDPGYTEQLSITRYDARFNVLEQQKFNSPKEVILWGYDYQYPVAKVINGDYATIRSIVEPGVLVSPANDEDLRNEINKIRIALANTKAQVVSYTYSPLVGMTSETDVNNKTTYYEYDGFGRLNVMRDHDKNVVKKLCYKYEGVNEDCSVVYYNAPRSVYITPVCSPGLTGKPYLYTVNAGTFSSTISQDDVEQKVANDIQTNGQTVANQYGACTANPTVFQNIEQTVLISSLNCGEGETGVPFKYIVPSNKYSSLISQEDADDKALNEIKVYAQDYANDHGQCTDQVPVIIRSEQASSQESYVQIINEYEDVVEELQFPVNRSAGMQVIFLPPGSYRFTFSAPRNLSGFFNNFFYSVLPDDYQWFLSDGYSSNAWRYLDTDYVTFTFGDYYILTSALF